MSEFDRLTEIEGAAKEKIYSDFDISFRKNRMSDDVYIKYDVQAISQAVINILTTGQGERPFKPLFGANIRKYLFENFTPMTTVLIENDIRSTLNRYEPRIRVMSVTFVDLLDERNALGVTIEAEIITPGIITTIEFLVHRQR